MISAPVRFSHLKAYGRSALHGHHARTAPEDEQTYPMERGGALHHLLFGTKKVVGYPGAVRRGKDYEAFVERNPGCEILTMADYDKARGMADAVNASTLAAPYLKGVHEQTLAFKWMGLECRTTPDVRGESWLTELKSTANADPAKFLWDARRRGYHAQLRFQEYGCEKHGVRILDDYIVAVESTAPYPVTVFHLEPEAREEGEKLLTLWAELLKNCEASNVYPAYSDCVIPLVWPKDDEFIYEEAA